MTTRLRVFYPSVSPELNFNDQTLWTLGTGWTFSGGVATYDGSAGAPSYLEFTGLIPGNAYELVVGVGAMGGGQALVTNGGSPDPVTVSVVDGRIVYSFVAFDDTIGISQDDDAQTAELTYLSCVPQPATEDLDLIGVETLPVTYSIGDIRSPEKRQQSFTKTIKLPGTPQNSRVFGHIYELGGEGKFDPRKIVNAVIEQDGVTVFQGTLQLINANRIADGFGADYDDIGYEVKVISSAMDLFQSMGEDLVETLDFSDLDHALTVPNIRATGLEGPSGDYVMVNGAPLYNWVDVTTPVDITAIDEYADAFGGRVKVTTSGAHSLSVDDQVWVQSTVVGQLNQARMGGYHTVRLVLSSTEVVLNTQYASLNFAITPSLGSVSAGQTIHKREPTGQGYAYPWIDQGAGFQPDQTPSVAAGALDHTASSLRPAIYLKQYMDRIFKRYGFNYQSNFFDSAYFRRIIVPFNRARLSLDEAVAQTRSMRATLTTDTMFGGDPDYLVGFDDDVTPPNGDPGSNYNAATFTYTVPATGDYTVYASGSVNFGAGPFGGMSSSTNWVVKRNGVVAGTGTNPALPLDSNDQYLNLYYTGPFVAGDQITVYIKSLGPFSVGIPFTLLEGSTMTVQYSSEEVSYGDVVTGNSITLKEVKCKDLLTDVIKTFNLHVMPAPGQDRVLIIEPRDDFYGPVTDAVDWDLDVGREMTVVPMGELTGRVFTYTFSDDGDDLNKAYKDRFAEVYGSYRTDVTNDFSKAVVETKVGFGATPLAGPARYYADNSNDAVTSRMRNAGDDGRMQTKPRLLFWAPRSGSIRRRLVDDTGNIVGSQILMFGYAGSVDKHDGPFYGLNFDNPKQLYWSYPGLPNNNIFNMFHRSYLEEISDKNSRVVTCYVNLTANQVSNLDFRRFVRIDGHLFRLNKVVDYDSISARTTKVELIRVLKVGATPEPVEPADLGKRPILIAGAVGSTSTSDPNARIQFDADNNVTKMASDATVTGSPDPANLIVIGGDSSDVITESDAVVIPPDTYFRRKIYSRDSLGVDRPLTPLKPGDLFGGGIVVLVYTDYTLSDPGNLWALIMSRADVGTGVAWSGNTITMAGTGNLMYGAADTAAAVAISATANKAVTLADSYVNPDNGFGVYSDWYLPSLFEMRAAFENPFLMNTYWATSGVASIAIPDANGMAGERYWTSTELAGAFAMTIGYYNVAGFDYANTYSNGQAKSSTGRVKAFRRMQIG